MTEIWLLWYQSGCDDYNDFSQIFHFTWIIKNYIKRIVFITAMNQQLASWQICLRPLVPDSGKHRVEFLEDGFRFMPSRITVTSLLLIEGFWSIERWFFLVWACSRGWEREGPSPPPASSSSCPHSGSRSYKTQFHTFYKTWFFDRELVK